MKKRMRSQLAALLGGVAMVTAGAVHAADVPESEDSIIIGINEWTGQHISSYIAGHILEKMGYNVEYKTAAMLPMGTAMADGNITLGLEMWDNNLGEWWPSQLENGAAEDLGTLGLDAREGVALPQARRRAMPRAPGLGSLPRLHGDLFHRRNLPGRALRRVSRRLERSGYPAHYVGGTALPGDPGRQ